VEIFRGRCPAVSSATCRAEHSGLPAAGSLRAFALLRVPWLDSPDGSSPQQGGPGADNAPLSSGDMDFSAPTRARGMRGGSSAGGVGLPMC